MNNKKYSKSMVKLPRISHSSSTSPHKNTRRSLKDEDSEGKLTAAAFGVYKTNLEPIAQHNVNQRREIASLTKMMTMLCTVRLCKKYKINMEKCYFRVTLNSAGLRGTSAQLESREWVTIQDLLHGLMLPSGNDAASVLAQNLGACIYYQRLGQAHLLIDLKSLDLTEDTWNIKIYSQQFVKIMNQTAKQIGMKDSVYINPHGLDSSFRLQAYSNVEDQAVLAKTLLEYPQCTRIMGTPSHTGQLKSIIGKEIEIRKKIWKNTHLLLNQSGFIGGKTGQTQFAGNCLMSYYESKNKMMYIIVVLGCSTKELRFSQTLQLVNRFILPLQN